MWIFRERRVFPAAACNSIEYTVAAGYFHSRKNQKEGGDNGETTNCFPWILFACFSSVIKFVSQFGIIYNLKHFLFAEFDELLYTL